MQRTISLYLIITIMTYLIVSFIHIDINFFNWEQEGRIIYVVISHTIFFVVHLLDYIKEDKGIHFDL